MFIIFSHAYMLLPWKFSRHYPFINAYTYTCAVPIHPMAGCYILGLYFLWHFLFSAHANNWLCQEIILFVFKSEMYLIIQGSTCKNPSQWCSCDYVCAFVIEVCKFMDVFQGGTFINIIWNLVVLVWFLVDSRDPCLPYKDLSKETLNLQAQKYILHSKFRF